jgi:RHS repeat-associated protein
VTTFGYDANGLETTRTLPNTVVQTTTRDNSGRPVRIRAVNGAGTVVSDVGYSYTAPGTTGPAGDRGFVQARTDHLGAGGPAGSVTTYGYDSLARLTAATEKTAAGAAHASWEYAYDAAGNRTSQTLTGATGGSATPATPAVTTTWGYNDANELTRRNGSTTGWSYDKNGNQLKSPDWGTARYGVRSSLRDITDAAAVKTAFEYLGDGNTTRLNAGDTAYTTGSLGLATATTGTDPSTIYRRLPNGQLLSTDAANAPRRYFLTDLLGSVVAITSDTGTVVASYSYDPYGNTRTATGTDAAANPIRYTGGYLDLATELYKFGARYYDPTTARFTQQDPSGQDANPYLYAAGNPINYVDPTGEVAWLAPLLWQAGRTIVTGLVARGGAAVARSSVAGTGSRLFGNSSLNKAGTQGLLNRSTSSRRLGWSVRPDFFGYTETFRYSRGFGPTASHRHFFPGEPLP